MFCTNCKTELPKNARFCAQCGTPVPGSTSIRTQQGVDTIQGDEISVGGSISGKGIAIGRGAQATVTEGLGSEDIARLFATIYQRIEGRPEDSKVDKEELTQTVQRIEKEVAKGVEADRDKVARWLKSLADVAPDILEVTVAALTSPVMGAVTAIRKLAERFKGGSG